MTQRLATIARTALAATFTAAACAAQEPSVEVVARTGLYTLQRGHTLHLNLAEVGDDAGPSQVVLRLFDDRGRLLRQQQGKLQPNRAVRLTFRLPGGGGNALLVRAEAVLTTSQANTGSAPILTVESVHEPTRASLAITECLLRYDPEGTGGRVTGFCGCDVRVKFTP